VCRPSGHRDNLCVIYDDPDLRASSGLNVENGVLLGPSDGLQIPGSASISAVELRWTPSVDLTKGEIADREFQKIYFDGQPYLHDNWQKGIGFTLPGPKANAFRIDFANLSCGEHTWRVDTGTTDFDCIDQGNGTGNCHPAVNIQRPGPTWRFTKLCCNTPPNISITNPADNIVYPANTSSVNLQWNIATNGCPTMGEYNRAVVTNISNSQVSTYAKVDASGNPLVATANYSQLYPVLGGSCNATARTFRWYTEAKNIGNIDQTYDRDPTGSGYRTFTVAGNIVNVSSTTLNSCYSTDASARVNFNVVINDQNAMDDTYRFEFTNTNTHTVTTLDSLQTDTNASDGLSCTTSESTVTCTVNFLSSFLGAGSYTVALKTNNGCNGAGTFTAVPNASNTPFTANFSIDAAGAVGGNLELNQEDDSDFVLTLAATGITPPVNFQFQAGLQQEGVGCAHDDYDINLGNVTCTDTTCESAPFGVDELVNPGNYCFRAVADSAYGCFSNTLRTGPFALYIVKVHMNVDTDDDLECDQNTAPTEGAPLGNVPVTLEIGAGSGFNRDTDTDGTATFAANLTGVSSVNVFTTCSNCIPTAQCRQPFIDCGGPNVAGEYEDFRNSVGNVRLPINLNLDAGPSVYDAYIRIGTVPRVEEWMSSMHGDIFAKGVDLLMCANSSQSAAAFDGAILERPEGTPYPSKGSLSGIPFTGGYLFTHAEYDTMQVETTNFVSEPSPDKRYALSLDKVPGTETDLPEDYLFSDTVFDALKEYSAPRPSDANYLPGGGDVHGVNLNAGGHRIYTVQNQSHMENLISSQFRLDDGYAVIYYMGDSFGDLVFNNPAGFHNLNGTGKVIIVTDRNVVIENSIGYSCWPTASGGSCGVYPVTEYSPRDNVSRPNIDATIISFGTITFENFWPGDTPPAGFNYDDALANGTFKTIKIGGSLIANDVVFGRKMMYLSSKYPGEAVSYDQNILLNLTEIERNSLNTRASFATSKVQLNYGY
jgi:hypothetical protein